MQTLIEPGQGGTCKSACLTSSQVRLMGLPLQGLHFGKPGSRPLSGQRASPGQVGLEKPPLPGPQYLQWSSLLKLGQSWGQNGVQVTGAPRTVMVP